jgi:hypothetical protein
LELCADCASIGSANAPGGNESRGHYSAESAKVVCETELYLLAPTGFPCPGIPNREVLGHLFEEQQRGGAGGMLGILLIGADLG